MITALRSWLCRMSRHDPAWAQSVTGVGMDWPRYYAISARRCMRTCRRCDAPVGEPVDVHTWEPIESLGIPSLCPDCKLVHGTEVCP